MIWQTRIVFPLVRLVIRNVLKGFTIFTLYYNSFDSDFKVSSEIATLALFPQQRLSTKESQFLTISSSSFSFDFSSYSFDPYAVYPGSVAMIFAATGKSETTTETTANSLVSGEFSNGGFESVSTDELFSRSTSDDPLTLVFAAKFEATTNEPPIKVVANFSSGNNPKEGPEAWRKISIPSKTSETISDGGWQTQGKRHRNGSEKDLDTPKSSNMVSVNGNFIKNPYLVLMGPEEDLEHEPQELKETQYPVLNEMEVHSAIPRKKSSSLPEHVLNQILFKVLASSSFPMIKMKDTLQL